MTPEELAKKVPKLWHAARSDAWPSIFEHGLMPAADLMELFDIPQERRHALMRSRREQAEALIHPGYGTAYLGDNRPLKERVLEKILDDGLTPADWLGMLNRRVFFFPKAKLRDAFMRAAHKEGQNLEVRAFDTLGLARRYGEAMEIAPFNTGAINRYVNQSPRRGLSTFSLLPDVQWNAWKRKRGNKSDDSIKEVIVTRPIPDIAAFEVDP